MWPFVFIFLLAGIGLLAAGRKYEAAARKTAGWPTTSGTLEHCEVVEREGTRIEDPSTWHLEIRYAYVVKGKTYHSNQYAFGYGDGRDDKPHRAVANDLSARSELVVHYDPARPSVAVLNTDTQTNLSQLGYGCLVAAGIAFLIALAGR